MYANEEFSIKDDQKYTTRVILD